MKDGSIKVEDLVFLDESGSKLGMSSSYARAEGGKRIVVNEPKNIAVSPNIEYNLSFQTNLHNHNQLLSLALQQAPDGSQIMS